MKDNRFKLSDRDIITLVHKYAQAALESYGMQKQYKFLTDDEFDQTMVFKFNQIIKLTERDEDE